MVTRNTDFVSSSSFSLPEDISRNLRRSAFLTGTAVGPETTRAAIEGALSVGADRASRQAALSEDRRQREEALAQQESQFTRSEALRREEFTRTELFNKRQAEKARSASFQQGIASAVTTVAGFGILKYFKIF